MNFFIRWFWMNATVILAFTFYHAETWHLAQTGKGYVFSALPCVMLIQGIGECYRRWKDARI